MAAPQWAKVPFDEAPFQNSDEAILTRAMAAAENAYMNEAQGWSRFPGLKSFTSFAGSRTYLTEHRDDLIAVTDQGRTYRVGREGSAEDVTGTPLSGGKRPMFDSTEDRLVMAAGGRILQLKGAQTEILSENAPLSTHVAFVDGYLAAIEPYSGRFWYSNPGVYETWEDLSVFTAEAKPDPVNAAVTTPYNELLIAGPDSIEQFERATSGTQPFYRRYVTGEGLYAPYTLLASEDGNYGVNKKREFVRFGGQIARPESGQISYPLERITDWTDAWTELIHIKGQRFILLQIPNATNQYDTDGITYLFDYRSRRWFELFGWDDAASRPTRWPGWSYQFLWGRHFVGVAGGIQELDLDGYSNAGAVQRMLIRTGHIDKWGPSHVDGFRIRLKRGLRSPNDSQALVRLRWRRDNQRWHPWVERKLGYQGDRSMVINYQQMGRADLTWQWEMEISDDVTVEFVGAEALVGRERR